MVLLVSYSNHKTGTPKEDTLPHVLSCVCPLIKDPAMFFLWFLRISYLYYSLACGLAMSKSLEAHDTWYVSNLGSICPTTKLLPVLFEREHFPRNGCRPNRVFWGRGHFQGLNTDGLRPS